MDSKQHISVVIAGHVDAGKSTFTGRLLFELGGISERELQKLKAEAESLGKGSFLYAFYTDNQKAERERGITINYNTKDFYTSNYHYTIIDAPGHKDFVKNMITGSSSADIGILMVPGSGDDFTTALAKGNRKTGEVEGQTRQHALLLNLLGIKQLIVCVNKMDAAKYSEEKFNEIKSEIQDMLVKVGWPKPFVTNSVPILPISAYEGDNLLTPSNKMPWFTGCKVKNTAGTIVDVNTVIRALNDFIQPPQRFPDAPLRMPVSGVHKIKGVGDVITGRLEQGKISPGDQIVFLPRHTGNLECKGKVFTVEMHHKSVPFALPGDNVGLNIKGLTKENMPKVGDIMILQNDSSIKIAKKIRAQIKVLDHPNELKVGYTPIASVRTAKSPVRMTQILWKMGKDTGGQKADNPVSIKAGDGAEVIFEPQIPIVVDEFKNCEGLGRIALFEGNGIVMIGKVIAVE